MSIHWRDRAHCLGTDPEWWYPVESDTDVSPQIRVCADCPVRRECGEEAVATYEREAIRAGYWLRRRSEREALRREYPHAVPGRRVVDRSCAQCGNALAARETVKCRPCAHDLVPVGPARERLQLLHQHRTYKQIAAESGLPLSAVLTLRSKEGTLHTARTTHDAIMAVPLPVGVA